MNYLLDKKIQRKKFVSVVLLIVIFFTLFYFRSGIFSGLSSFGHKVFRPVLVLGNNVGDKFSSLGSYFISKSSLRRENEDLKSKLNEQEIRMLNYNSILVENISLKEILGRKNPKTSMILAGILSKPNQSLYDTLVLDAGEKQGIKIGDMVFALGNIPLGRVADVYPNSSKVILFSNAGEKTQVVVGDKPARTDDSGRSGGNVFMEIVGRGGGNFEMIMPRDFVPQKGDQVFLPGIASYVLGIIETILSDPRDPFQKALLISPVNVQELKFVEVEK